MRLILFNLLFLISFAAFANQNKYIYEIEDSIIIVEEKENIIVSESCFINGCDALFYAKNKKIRFKDLKLNGGKNPAAAACTQVLNGAVLMLKNSENGIQSFCLFSDGSIISNKSISFLIK